MIEVLRARADALGMDWKELTERVTSRQTGWRVRKGEASLATARKIAAILDRESDKRGLPRTSDIEGVLKEWLETGRELIALSPDKFESTLRVLQKWCESELATRAILKPTPDDDAE